MGKLLNAAISSYYTSNKRDDDSGVDALTAMKTVESLVVEEVLREHAHEVERQERAFVKISSKRCRSKLCVNQCAHLADYCWKL